MPLVEVNSTSIHYEMAGEGEPVLFIHGLGSSCFDWERQVEYFSGSHSVVTLCLRGHGLSGKPRGKYTIAGFARDVAGLIEHLDVAPVPLVGISLGGMVAFQLAVDRPELVDRLAVVNALPDGELLANARGQILARKAIVRIFGMRRMGEYLGPRLFPDEDMAEERRLLAERWEMNDRKSYLKAFQAILDWPGVTNKLGSLSGPVLMVSSDHDYVPLEQKDPYLELMPGVDHAVIENAHHAVPVERPERFNRILEDFLSS